MNSSLVKPERRNTDEKLGGSFRSGRRSTSTKSQQASVSFIEAQGRIEDLDMKDTIHVLKLDERSGRPLEQPSQVVREFNGDLDELMKQRKYQIIIKDLPSSPFQFYTRKESLKDEFCDNC